MKALFLSSCIFLCGLRLSLAASSASVDPIYQLFDDEPDRMAIVQPPLEWDPLSLGFDAASEKRMVRFLNSTAVTDSLARLVNTLSVEDLRMPSKPGDISAFQVKEKDGPAYLFPAGQLFDTPESAQLSKNGESQLVGLAEIAGRSPFEPISILASAPAAAVAKKQADEIASFLAEVLMRSPEEFLVQFQADTRSPATVKIQSLEAKP